MRKMYLVKKDPTTDGQDNWITMNGYEFAMFMKTPEGKARKDNFAQLDACRKDDVIIVMECCAEMARELRAEKDRHDYLIEQEIASGYSTFSYSRIYSEEEDMTGEEMLQDMECDVEAIAINRALVSKLFQVLECLSPEERALIDAMYLCPNRMSEKEYAHATGECKTTIRSRKHAVLNKLKKLMGEEF